MYLNITPNDTKFNFKMDEEYQRSLFLRITGCFVTCILILMALLGNVAVIIVSIWDENIRSQTGNILNLFLAIIDVLTAVFAMLPSALAVAYDYWPLGDTFCRIHAGLTYLFATCSSFGSSVISMDRAFLILHPFKYKSTMTHKKMFCIIGLIVSQNSILLVVPFLIPYIRYDYLEAVCSIQLSEWKTLIGTIIMHGGCVFGCYIPFLITSISNILILKQVRKSAKVMSKRLYAVKHNSRDQSIDKLKNVQDLKKSAISMMAIVCVFFICFVPCIIMKEIKVVYGIDGSPILNYVSTILVFTSSATNPFLYGILRKDYRHAFKILLRLIREKVRDFM